ncbi:MAG: hypothetical protein ACKPKO_08540, partial [Candidatus Fonsibacter sp.]
IKGLHVVSALSHSSLIVSALVLAMEKVALGDLIHNRDKDPTVPVFDLTNSSDSDLDISLGTWQRLDELVAAHMAERAGPSAAVYGSEDVARMPQLDSGGAATSGTGLC